MPDMIDGMETFFLVVFILTLIGIVIIALINKKSKPFNFRNYKYIEQDPMMKEGYTIGDAYIKFSLTYPSHPNYKKNKSVDLVKYKAMVKENGLVFYKVETNRRSVTRENICFGIKFKNIKSIVYEVEKSSWIYRQYIIIKMGDKGYTEELILTSSNCSLLLDEIRPYYNGQIIDSIK